MKIFIIALLFFSTPAFGQTTGYVLKNIDGSVNLPSACITSGMLAGSLSLTTPNIGAATGTSLAVTGNISSSGGSIGYATGTGGTVTQQTNKSTGVTINKICGQITMNNAALAAGAEVTFTVTNSTVASTDVVIVNVQSVGTAGSYLVTVGAVANGSFSVTVSNASAGSLSQALVLNYAVVKSVNN